jgi:hypothetical protein
MTPKVTAYDYLEEPKPNSKVWRYMDYSKFIRLISNAELYFVRIDHLTDKYEGTLSQNIIDDVYNQYNKIVDFYEPPEVAKLKALNDISHMKKYDKYTLVNCWAQNSDECYALWKIYLGCQPFGVSIQTRFKNLQMAVLDNNISVVSKKVYYSPVVKAAKMSSVYYRKSKYYKFENEVRLAIFSQWVKFAGEPKFVKGTNIKVDLNKLIEKIYVSPFAPDYFIDYIQFVVKDKLKYNFPVIKSKIKVE